MGASRVLVGLGGGQTDVVFLLHALVTLIPLEDVPGVLLVSKALVPLELDFAVLVFDELRRCHHAWLDLESTALGFASLVLGFC